MNGILVLIVLLILCLFGLWIFWPEKILEFEVLTESERKALGRKIAESEREHLERAGRSKAINYLNAGGAIKVIGDVQYLI